MSGVTGDRTTQGLSVVPAPRSRDASPYPGLSPFSTEQHSYFFGREAETRVLLSNMFASRLTVVHGPSGVGKSSVINAGLMPVVNAQEDVLAVVFRKWAGQHPTRELQRAIRAQAGLRGVTLREDPDDDLLGTCRRASEVTGCYLMLVLDQFEELFLYRSAGAPFDQALGEVLSDTSLPYRVLISMREDSLARLDRLEDYVHNPFDNVFRLEHLSRSGGRDAIVRPLEQHRDDTGSTVTAEDELVERVLDGVRAGRIMLSPGGGGVVERHLDSDRVEVAYLQLVMERLWTYETHRGSDVLRADTLEVLGGVRRAVRSRFTELMDSLSEADQDLAAKLFYFLVTPSKTKIAWSPADLAHYAQADPAATRRLLAQLADPRFRMLRTVDTLGDHGTEVVYEIYHDILARAVIEWRDHREARRAEAHRRHLEELERQLEAVEHLVEDGPHEGRDALYPLLQSLAAELQPVDAGLAERARHDAARLLEQEGTTKSSRSASLIERKQVRLLQDEVELLMRSREGNEDLAGLYVSRLHAYTVSPDPDVRRDAALLERQLMAWSGVGSSTVSIAPTAAAPSASGDDPTMIPSSSVHSRTTFGSSDRLGSLDLEAAFRRPLWLRWDFYAFLLVVPLLNLLPLLVSDVVLTDAVPPYDHMRDGPLVAVVLLLVLLWTGLHLYAVIDNGLRALGSVLAPLAPWVDGVGVREKLSGWPLNVMWPVALGALAMWAAAQIELPATIVFYLVVFVMTALLGVRFTDAESLVWSPFRFRQAFRRRPRSAG